MAFVFATVHTILLCCQRLNDLSLSPLSQGFTLLFCVVLSYCETSKLSISITLSCSLTCHKAQTCNIPYSNVIPIPQLEIKLQIMQNNLFFFKLFQLQPFQSIVLSIDDDAETEPIVPRSFYTLFTANYSFEHITCHSYPLYNRFLKSEPLEPESSMTWRSLFMSIQKYIKKNGGGRSTTRNVWNFCL